MTIKSYIKSNMPSTTKRKTMEARYTWQVINTPNTCSEITSPSCVTRQINGNRSKIQLKNKYISLFITNRLGKNVSHLFKRRVCNNRKHHQPTNFLFQPISSPKHETPYFTTLNHSVTSANATAF